MEAIIYTTNLVISLEGQKLTCNNCNLILTNTYISCVLLCGSSHKLFYLYIAGKDHWFKVINYEALPDVYLAT